MKYRVAVAGFILFFVGFMLASRAYDFVCGCATPNPVTNMNSCYQCMSSPTYQNDIVIFQAIMIVSVFIVLYGFFSEFDYGANK